MFCCSHNSSSCTSTVTVIDNEDPVITCPSNISVSNDAGVLGRICSLIGEQKANISNLKFSDRKPDFFRLTVDVELSDAEHLHRVITALEAESDVAEICRVSDPERERTQN